MKNYYIEFINFFKKHNLYDETIFNYIRNNMTIFDYRDKDQIDFIGCYYTQDKDGTLKKIHIYVPMIKNQITLLINIHEYVHAIIMYKNINKKVKISKDIEILPMLYELIYIKEHPNEELEKFKEKINTQITNSSSIEYKIALAVQNELFNYYNTKKPNLQKLKRKAKQLTRRNTVK